MFQIHMQYIFRIDDLQEKHPEGRVPEDFLQELYKWALESKCHSQMSSLFEVSITEIQYSLKNLSG